jgi:hypothetical protein
MIEVRVYPPARVDELERWCNERKVSFELRPVPKPGALVERLWFKNSLHALSFCQEWPAQIVGSD